MVVTGTTCQAAQQWHHAIACRLLGVERLPGDQGWRTSLGLAGLPAVILTLAAILLPETPNSLAERGRVQEARRILEKIRGTDDVTAEMNDIIAAAEEAKGVGHSSSCKWSCEWHINIRAARAKSL